MIKWSARLAVLAVAASLCALAAQASAAQRPRRDTPPDSFLWQKANSVPEFIAQVEQNDVIRKRLAKHFHVAEADLVNYLKRNLTVVTIRKSGRYPVWGVTESGRVYRSSSYFRKGWRAFGLKDGTALFKWSCGNPMVTALPRVPVPIVKRPPPEVPPVVLPPAPPPPDMTETVAPVVHEPAEVIPPEPLYLAAASPPADPATMISRPELLVPWPLLPLLIWSGGGGGEFIPIPEPASLTLLGMGAVVLGAVGRLRRRAR